MFSFLGGQQVLALLRPVPEPLDFPLKMVLSCSKPSDGDN